MLSEEQVKEIKKQLVAQLEKTNLPNKEEIKNSINHMNPSQLEEFLKENQIEAKQENKISCIFCAIAKNQIPSYKIAENKNAIAVLEINPLSKGHTIIIPLTHESIEKSPASVLSLAKKTAKKIKSKLKPEDVKLETSSIQGHGIINIIPIYKDGELKQKKASEEELREIQEKLVSKKREKKTPKEKKLEKSFSNLIKIPRRIP